MKIPQIDWEELQEYLGTEEDLDRYPGDAPSRVFGIEAIVHELCHVYDCKGTKAFTFFGDQEAVGDIFDKKYNTVDDIKRDEGEIKASVLTFLVLQPLGCADLVGILTNLRDNLVSAAMPVYFESEFIAQIGLKDKIDDAKRIRKFILEFEVKPRKRKKNDKSAE